MIDALGIIIAGDSGLALGEITRNRSIAAIPVACRYRLIDFILSNMVNSGICNIGVPTQTHYRSLMDHLGSGKEWDLNRKMYGLFILPPFLMRDTGGIAHGDIELLNGISDYLTRSKQKYVLLAGSDLIFNTTFEGMMEFHIAHQADITVMYNEVPAEQQGQKHVNLQIDGSGRVHDIEANPASGFSTKASMGIYLMEKEFLEYQINRCISRGRHDFVMDVLINNVSDCAIYGCKYDGYVGRIDSIASYYKRSMEILSPEVCNELFGNSNAIFTKVKDQVPTIYGEKAVVTNSLVADGCVINGVVENSLLSRGVIVEEGAHVSNCIVMQNAQLQRNTVLEYGVLDKSVIIRAGKHLCGQENYPVVIGKNVVV